MVLSAGRGRCLLCLALACVADGVQYSVGGPAVSVFGDSLVQCDAMQFTTDSGCSCDTVIRGAFVKVKDAYQAGDWLHCETCTELLIGAVFDAETGQLTLKGERSLRTYIEAMGTVMFSTTSGNVSDRKVAFNYGDALHLTSGAPEFYRRVATVSSASCSDEYSCTWEEAQRDCADPRWDFLGLVGYLFAPGEDELSLRELWLDFPVTAWVGCTDVAEEGVFRMVTGSKGCPPYNTSTAKTGWDAFTRSACDLGAPFNNALGKDNMCTGSECGMGLSVPSDDREWADGQPNDARFPPRNGVASTSMRLAKDFCRAESGKLYAATYWQADYQREYVCEYGSVGQLCVALGHITGESTVLVNDTYDECNAPTSSGYLPNGGGVPVAFPDACENAMFRSDTVTCDKAVITSAHVAIDRGFHEGDTLTCNECAKHDLEFSSAVYNIGRHGPYGNAHAMGPYTVGEWILEPAAGGRKLRSVEVMFEALRSILFTTTSKDRTPRRLVWNLGAGFWLPETGSYYTRHPDGGLDWDVAQRYCETRSIMGLRGYLPTLTTEVEHVLVSSRSIELTRRSSTGRFWLGATDIGTEGSWRWVTGPEGCPGSYDLATCGDAVAHDLTSCTACNLGPTVSRRSAEGCEAGYDCNGGTLFAAGERGVDWRRTAGIFEGFSRTPDQPDDSHVYNTNGGFGSNHNAGQDFAMATRQHFYDAQKGGFVDNSAWEDYPVDCIKTEVTLCEHTVGTFTSAELVLDLQRTRGMQFLQHRHNLPDHQVCPDGQTCSDAVTTLASVGDWVCNCDLPFSGSQRTGPAVCSLNECVADCPTCMSAAPCSGGQTCVDPGTGITELSDWECRCNDPANGSAVAGPASCSLDECAAVCTSCMSMVTACAMGQACIDSDTAANATGTWECVCDAPAVGRAVGGPATCSYDECLPGNPGALCANQGQSCQDPVPFPETTADFVCTCTAPASGNPATGSPAVCVQNECEHGRGKDLCVRLGQDCSDPDETFGVWDDFVCTCPAPAWGPKVTGTAASCTLDECKHGAGQACISAEQNCIDQDTSYEASGDYICTCSAPAFGAPTTGGAAACVLEECTTGRCAAGQTCTDYNTSWASAGDWECRCNAPFDGVAIGRNAVCVLDECNAAGAICYGSGQRCDDGDDAVAGDWSCLCSPPKVGFAVQGVALCAEDECLTHSGTCSDAGQQCADPDRHADGDWQCECVLPTEGEPALRRSAACTLNECKLYGGTCEAVGQTCAENSTRAVGDWSCSCRPPLVGVAVQGAPAACVLVTAAPPIITGGRQIGHVGEGVAAAAVVAGGAGPALQLLLVLGDCNAVGGDEYPMPLHPLGIAIAGSKAAGAVVGNFAIAVGLWVVLYVSVRCLSALGGRCIPLLTEVDAQGLVRFPSAPLSIFLFLYQGTALAAMELLAHSRTPLELGIGLAGFVFCTVTPIVVFCAVVRDVPLLSHYRTDPAPSSTLAAFLTGPGEWVSRHRDNHWTNRWSCIVRTYRTPVAWYGVVDVAGAAALAAVSSLKVGGHDPVFGCGHVKAASACVFSILFAAEVAVRPHCHSRNNCLDPAALACQAAGMAFMAAGFYNRDLHHWTIGVSGILIMAAMGIVIVRVLLDLLGLLYVVATGRRRRLQDAEFARHDAARAFTKVYCAPAALHETCSDPALAAQVSWAQSDGCLYEPRRLPSVTAAPSARRVAFEDVRSPTPKAVKETPSLLSLDAPHSSDRTTPLLALADEADFSEDPLMVTFKHSESLASLSASPTSDPPHAQLPPAGGQVRYSFRRASPRCTSDLANPSDAASPRRTPLRLCDSGADSPLFRSPAVLPGYRRRPEVLIGTARPRNGVPSETSGTADDSAALYRLHSPRAEAFQLLSSPTGGSTPRSAAARSDSHLSMIPMASRCLAPGSARSTLVRHAQHQQPLHEL